MLEEPNAAVCRTGGYIGLHSPALGHRFYNQGETSSLSDQFPPEIQTNVLYAMPHGKGASLHDFRGRARLIVICYEP